MIPAITLRCEDPAPAHRPPRHDAFEQMRREHAEKVRRLEETILSLDNLLAPQDWLDAGDGFPGPGGWRINRPAQRTQDRSNAPLSYLNEDEWRQHIALARDLCTRNHLALGFRDHVSNFIGPVAISFVRRGQKPGAGASGGTNDDSLATACQQVWDEWCEFAEWGQGEEDREEECRRRLIVEGEATLRFFVGDEGSDGLPHVRHVEPELIRTPSGHSTVDPFGWGVITAEGDDEREQGLWLCDPVNVALGRVVDMRDYVRMKFNVDRTVKRGLSDFFPVADHLRKILGLLGNMAHVARLQAAIAWWEEYPTATLDQVMSQVRMGADYQRPKLNGNPGASTDITSYEAGTVVRTEGGRAVKPGPVSDGTSGFETVERIVLRAVGFRWGCPSYFSGDGDASFASVLVTGSPFVRITESKQERVKAFACRVATRVLEFAERSGRLPVGTSKQVRPVGTCRPVVIADEEKKARTFLSLYAAKCASPMEYIRSTGADPAQVAAEIKEWEAKFPPQQPPGGLMPPDAPPADPDPTPPGSAGGDGSSPNPTDALEAKREGEVWQGGSGRWFTLRDGHVQPAAAPANADSSTARAPAAAVLAKHPLADKQYLTHLADAAPTQDARDYLETAAWNVPGERTQLDPAERRHQTVERLAAAHRDAVADGKPEAAEHVAQVLRWFGGTFEGPEPGAAVPFDGAVYDADAGRTTVWTGDASTVARQPVRGPDGRLAIKGEVRPAKAEGRVHESPPGAPPRPGLVWNEPTHRWRDPHTGDEHEKDSKHADVNVSTFTTKPEVMAGALKAVLGDAATPHHAADAAGAKPGDRVKIVSAGTDSDDGSRFIYVQVKSADGRNATRTLHVDPTSGRRWVTNILQEAPDGTQGRGEGTANFARQAAAAAKLGFDEIRADAGSGELNGYYTLPRWGYDGPIPSRVRAKLPPDLQGAKSILDLTATESGRAWWKQNGWAAKVTFDLRQGSRSRQVLADYLKERAPRDSPK